ncbi:MAG: AI-2E family transporter [Alphaproteobacteria bacterium]|nr:AI-2E family transporter [Alphaproteobacteria bacterium]
MTKQGYFWLLLLIACIIVLYFLSGMLLPFVLGIAVAYFLNPLCNYLEKIGLARGISAALTLIGFILIFLLAGLLLFPMVSHQTLELLERGPSYINSLIIKLQPILDLIQQKIRLQESLQLREILAGQMSSMLNFFGNTLAGILSRGAAFVNVISLLLITPVVAFYILKDWNLLTKYVDHLLPRLFAKTIRRQIKDIDKTLAGFVRGQAIVCLLLGFYYSISLSLLGLDFGLSLGALIGFLSFIPYVGSITGFIISVSLTLAQFAEWTPFFIVIGIFIIGQILEGYVLTPKLVGSRIGLHPVWIIFALLAGGTLFGFLGILISIPIAASLGVLLRFVLDKYFHSQFYLGKDLSKK